MGGFFLVGKGWGSFRAKVRRPRKRTAVNLLVWARQQHLYLGSCCARRTQLNTAAYEVVPTSSLVLTRRPAFALCDQWRTCSSSNPSSTLTIPESVITQIRHPQFVRQGEPTRKCIPGNVFVFLLLCVRSLVDDFCWSF